MNAENIRKKDDQAPDHIIKEIAEEMRVLPFVSAVVLGGSLATGTAGAGSDIDIGIYYRADDIDYTAMNAAAARLDDGHRENLICRAGEWGNWVNCGGWLVVGGREVDLIMRDLDRVVKVIDKSDTGEFGSFYQPGHPHAYIDVMYRGELASCKTLYASGEFINIKLRAERYPAPLKKSLTDFFSFESGFSCMLAEKALTGGDLYYLSGHLFRSVSALNQLLFAINEKWCINEKKAAFRIDTFEKRPDNYSERVGEIFRSAGASPGVSVQILKRLCQESDDLLRAERL